MKITREQLRQLINEEKTKLLNEYTPARARSASEILADLHEALDELIGAVGYEEAANELTGIAEELSLEAAHEKENPTLINSVYENAEVDNMPESWKQILGPEFGDKK